MNIVVTLSVSLCINASFCMIHMLKTLLPKALVVSDIHNHKKPKETMSSLSCKSVSVF